MASPLPSAAVPTTAAATATPFSLALPWQIGDTAGAIIGHGNYDGPAPAPAGGPSGPASQQLEQEEQDRQQEQWSGCASPAGLPFRL
jgi:hypothetical protein